MPIIKIAPAQNAQELFTSAGAFLLPYEKSYCSLMQRVIERSEDVFVICDDTSATNIRGVFFYNGHSFTPCIPRITGAIHAELLAFFRTHRFTCLSGKFSCVQKVKRIYKEATSLVPGEERRLFLMHTERAAAPQSGTNRAPQGTTLVTCTAEHSQALMPLQTAYAREEVSPPWQEVLPYVERYALEGALKAQHVLALHSGGAFVAKAQTNALTEHYWQLGGVYTKKEFRGKGYASFLTAELSRMAHEHGVSAVLYVRTKNESAIKAYRNAGFTFCGKYSILYYR